MNRWLWGALLTVAVACGSAIDGGGSSTEDGGTAILPPVCSPSCEGPSVCIGFPGSAMTFCGNGCQSDDDCPAFFACSRGSCTPLQCSTCPTGTTCEPPTPIRRGQECRSNTECPLASFCDLGSSPPACRPYQACVPCVNLEAGGAVGCGSCSSNAHCQAGEVCVEGTCQACTSDSQCGPSAQCKPTILRSSALAPGTRTAPSAGSARTVSARPMEVATRATGAARRKCALILCAIHARHSPTAMDCPARRGWFASTGDARSATPAANAGVDSFVPRARAARALPTPSAAPTGLASTATASARATTSAARGSAAVRESASRADDGRLRTLERPAFW
jgi:hypothetical protein